MSNWMPNVEHIETDAHGPAIDPIAVVDHIMQGQQSTMIVWARERPWVTPKSAHFTIGRDGRIVQHVGIRTKAWHAGRLDPGRPPTWRLYQAGTNPNDYTVGIEHGGDSGAPWTPQMLEASKRVHRWIFEELDLPPTRDHLIGHYEIAPASRAHDPGPTWPIDAILKVIQPTLNPTPILKAMTQAQAEDHFVKGLFEVLGHKGKVEKVGNKYTMTIEWG